MTDIIYGTGNPAKIETMRKWLARTEIRVLSPADLGLALPEVEENGSDPLQNAVIKALACWRAFGRPVFSCDSGLWIQGLPPERQPGVHIRRVGGRSLDDEEMTAYYGDIAASLGGRCRAQYRNGIAMMLGEGRLYSSMEDSLSTRPFDLISTPHPRRVPGYPLDRLSVDPDSGRYYYDMPEDALWLEGDDRMTRGFCGFFQRALAQT